MKRDLSPRTYIMASRTLVLYVGVSSDLSGRVFKHKRHMLEGFSAKYRCDRLVYFERFGTMEEAIAREKEIKGWRRAKKIALIKTTNSTWIDLSEGWCTETQLS
jgi:putative endonuclease